MVAALASVVKGYDSDVNYTTGHSTRLRMGESGACVDTHTHGVDTHTHTVWTHTHGVDNNKADAAHRDGALIKARLP